MQAECSELGLHYLLLLQQTEGQEAAQLAKLQDFVFFACNSAFLACKMTNSVVNVLLGADILADADLLWCPSPPASLRYNP